MNKNHIVFLDWDGTLCWTRFWGSLRAKDSPNYEMGQKIEQTLFSEEKQLLNDWMRGKVRSEETNKLLSEKTGMDPKVLWQIFVRDCETMVFDSDLREKIAQLRSKAFVILVTGNMDCFNRFVVPSLRLNEVFDAIVSSSELGYMKTENNGETFLMFSRSYGVPLSRTFLIDDSLKTCDYFEALGGQKMFVKNGKEDTTRYLNDISIALENATCESL